MPRKSVDLSVVRELAQALPDVEQSTSWGALSFKVGGRMFACQAIHSSAEPNSLMVRIDKGLRDELLSADPDVYYITPHYEPYPAVVVRLSRVTRAALAKVLGTACLFTSSAGPARARSGKSSRKRATRTRPSTRGK
jgi:hypothetical protein